MIDTKCMYNFQVNYLPVSLMKIMCTELSQIDKKCIHVGFFLSFFYIFDWFVLFCICLILITD